MFRPTGKPGSAGDPVDQKARKDDPQLEIRATLRCPFCLFAVDVSTKPYRLALSANESWTSRSHHALVQLRQARCCKNCGIVSELPDLQAQRLKKSMERIMTDEWADEQARGALAPHTEVSDELKDLATQIHDQVRKTIQNDFGPVVRQEIKRALAENEREIEIQRLAKLRVQAK